MSDECNPLNKPSRDDDGSFKQKSGNVCIMCGAYCGEYSFSGIEKHHGKSKGSGGDNTWLNKFELCHNCHRKAQEYREGYLLADLILARDKYYKMIATYKALIGCQE